MPPNPDCHVWTLSASLVDVDTVCLEAGQLMAQYPIEEVDRFAIELLLREALTNAVTHGCQGNPGLQPTCSLTVCPKEVAIMVSDPGPGFDWMAALTRAHDELDQAGRGLMIYAHYATRFGFNPSGNQITLVRELGKGMVDEK
jgi:serine/threonine-protein kinase RsbW